MGRSQMLSSVIQAVCLDLLDNIVSHHSVHTVWSDAEKQFAHLAPAVNGTNSTLPGDLNSSTGGPEWAKYLKSDLPRRAIILFVCDIFFYYEYIWLEKMLPTRSRAFALAPPTTPRSPAAEKAEGDEEVEEEIIKKWIAQGKVKRSSVNWCNVFMKWILHLTIGLILWQSLWIITEGVVEWKKRDWFWDEFKYVGIAAICQPFNEAYVSPQMPIRVPASWISTMPLSSFVGFVIIPAYKRIVFDSAAGLAGSIFFGAFLNKFIPWVMRQEWMQEALKAAANGTLTNGTTANSTDSKPSFGIEL
jgi:hypothetical protein